MQILWKCRCSKMKAMYSFYSKPKTNMHDSEEQVLKQFERHNGVIITKWSEKFIPKQDVTKLNWEMKWHDDNSMYYRKTPGWFMFAQEKEIKEDNFLSKKENFYETFNIPKASGGYRTITAPIDCLKIAQKQILKDMTNKMKYLPSNNAHGFTKNRNCKTAMQVHQNNKSKYFLKLDIHDFFGSVTKTTIENAMEKHWAFKALTQTQKYYILEICTLNDVLPQGSPMSPMLGNLVLHEFDYYLDKKLKKEHLIYTRYADDLLISSTDDFRNKVPELIEYIKSELGKLGLTISDKKTRYGNYSGRNWNLGIMYNKDGNLTVGYKKKKLFKNILHNMEKQDEIKSEDYMKIQGQLAYAAYIEPEYFEPFIQRLNKLKEKIAC